MGRVLGAANRASRLAVVVFIIVTGLHADPSAAQEPVRPAAGARPVAENVAGGEQPPTGDPRRPEADGLRATARSAASPAGATDRPSLVNDPTIDGLNDTQVGSTLTLSGGNVVSAYFDSGSTAVGNQRTGYSVSTDGGRSFVDKGMLPASVAGAGRQSRAGDRHHHGPRLPGHDDLQWS